MDLGSQYGFMTAVGVGVSGVFYPMGLSSGREARDDGVEFVKTRMSPYFHFAVIPTKISFSLPLSSSTTTPTSSSGAINQPYFAAEVIETDLGVGLDYPFSENIVAFVELEYRFAAYTAQETTTGAISYSGPALMLGIMTNFY